MGDHNGVMDRTVAEYLARFDGPVRSRLEEIRALIHEVVPEAEEGAGYGIAEFWIDGTPAIYLGAFARHISLYPVRFLPPALEEQASTHLSGKATAKFAHAQPLPTALIARLVRQMADNALQGLL